jgi:hypothetical protein
MLQSLLAATPSSDTSKVTTYWCIRCRKNRPV